ncbi:MAG: glucokinase [Hormoscilla sp. SP5CHS1]|nr:glucokinase [Hormoscilla sp. SP12CHS1]MBC6452845.1 glucokinase [Hormoscilla sp. SP5CHS1]
MTLLLAGDIGGTKTILRLVKAPADGDEVLHEQTYPSQNYPDLVPIVREFLAGREAKPEKACFAIAGPVVNNRAQMTNLPWKELDNKSLETEMEIGQVSLINDFAAIGYGVLGLKSSDIYTLQAGELDPEAPIAVIGAGTGLGEAFLVNQGSNHRIFASEGGHADFAPRNELEFQLLKYLREKYDLGRISVERVVSGQGIVAIYQFLRDCAARTLRDRPICQESSEVGDIIRTWEQEIGREKTVDPAATIAIAATAKRDILSERTMQMFIEAYGAEAGNLALKLLPYCGLYIAGGIAAKNHQMLESEGFMQAFTDKGRVSNLLEKVPVHIVLNQQVGLIGAAICAAQL